MAQSSYSGDGSPRDPFVVTFGTEDPSTDPKRWSVGRKWSILLVYSFGMMSGLFSISAFTSGFPQMIADLKTTPEALAAGQTVFLGGLAIGSLVWPAMGDLLGRRRMAVGTLAAFSAFSLATAEAHNITAVLFSRFFAGFFASGMQTLGPACLASLFDPADIAIPFVVAAIVPFTGPSVGPLCGGYITEHTGNWRTINWVIAAFAALMAVLSILIPELHGPTILRRRAARLSKESGLRYVSAHEVDDAGRANTTTTFKAEARLHVVKPFIYLLKEPIVLLLSVYLAFLYAILQIFFTSFPIIYEEGRRWSQGAAGLPYIGLIVGGFLAVPVTKVCTRPYLRRLEQGQATPEHRLYFAMLSGVLLPISLFWMGWTASPSVHCMNPIVAGGIFGFAQIGIMLSVYVYFSDLYSTNVSAVFAGMKFGASSAFPLFAEQLYQRLGVAWACSLIAFILMAFMPLPFVLYGYGPAIRGRSKLVAATEAAPTSKAAEVGADSVKSSDSTV